MSCYFSGHDRHLPVHPSYPYTHCPCTAALLSIETLWVTSPILPNITANNHDRAGWWTGGETRTSSIGTYTSQFPILNAMRGQCPCQCNCSPWGKGGELAGKRAGTDAPLYENTRWSRPDRAPLIRCPESGPRYSPFFAGSSIRSVTVSHSPSLRLPPYSPEGKLGIVRRFGLANRMAPELGDPKQFACSIVSQQKGSLTSYLTSSSLHRVTKIVWDFSSEGSPQSVVQIIASVSAMCLCPVGIFNTDAPLTNSLAAKDCSFSRRNIPFVDQNSCTQFLCHVNYPRPRSHLELQ